VKCSSSSRSCSMEGDSDRSSRSCGGEDERPNMTIANSGTY
jgi:hypothetical protein